MIRELWSYSSYAKLHEKVQCSHCLLNWNQRIVCCTCGQCLVYSESRRKFSRTKTGCNFYLGLRDKERRYPWCSTRQDRGSKRIHLAWNTWKRCCEKVDSQGEHFTGMHDRLLRDHNSQSDGQNNSAKSWMNLRKKTIHTNSLQRKRERYKGQWYLTLNKAGKNGPMKLRPDFRAAVMMKIRLHHESGEPIEEPIHPGQQRRIRQGQEHFSEDYLSSARVDLHTGW